MTADEISESQLLHGLSYAELHLWGAMFGWTVTVERFMQQAKKHPPRWRKVSRVMTSEELANVPIGYCWSASVHGAKAVAKAA